MQLHDGFRIGEWAVEPASNRLVGPDTDAQINTRSMDVLLCLADNAGRVVTRQDFSDTVWRDTVVTDDALTWSISELRRKLGDSAQDPRYIETIPKRGYRLIAPVQPLDEVGDEPVEDTRGGHRAASASSPPRRRWRLPLLAAALVLLAALALEHLPIGDNAPEQAAETTEGIAVLPLSAIVESSELPLAEGLHQDLLTRLSELSGLHVISATSMRRYRDTDKSIPEIAAELDVDWIVEGAVQQAGARFRVNVQLIDTAADTHRWARTYEGELTASRLFEAQSEIIDDIAGSIETTLEPVRQPPQLPTDNLDAYALSVQARVLTAQRSETAMRRGAKLYEQATELDERYADAWAGRADAMFLLHYYGYESGDGTLETARELARTALAIDHDHPWALTIVGLVAMRLDHDLPAALAALREARTHSPAPVGWLAWMEAVAGDLQTGLSLTREQILSGPFAPSVHMSLAMLELCDGNLDQALSLAERAAELSPAYATAWRLQGQVLLLSGRTEAAINAFQEAMTLAGSQPPARDLAWLALARARSGHPVDALVHDVLSADDHLAKSLVHLAGEDLDAALAALGEIRWNDFSTLTVRFHPVFDPLRKRSDWNQLIAQIDEWWGLAGDH